MIIIQIIILLALIFVAFVTLKNEQTAKLNWSIFYSTLYVATILPLVNYGCVNFGFWVYKNTSLDFQMPFDLYFLWVVLWGIVPMYFAKGKHILFISLFIFWIDLLFMPQLTHLNLLTLNKNWLLGELLTIALVFIPAYIWGTLSYQNKFPKIRSFFQVLIMGSIFMLGLPLMLFGFRLMKDFSFSWSPIEFQILLIIIFPALIAVYDLSTKGKGTPFPYDPTKKLVQTGVYAYIKNPIQWSFTLMFIPLAIHFQSYILLIGMLSSIAYAFGISDFQEYDDMEQRFGEKWLKYKKNVPKWRFLWIPKEIPIGTIYFNKDCNNCNQFREWFLKYKAINLDIKTSKEAKTNLLAATYIDHNGNEYKSVKAIAHSFEHINLAYASLGWFMRFPIISHLLQLIVDAMDYGEMDSCENYTRKE